MTMENPRHLGDGAYATVTDWGSIILTANHHDPAQATDVIELDPHGVRGMKRLIQEMEEE